MHRHVRGMAFHLHAGELREPRPRQALVRGHPIGRLGGKRPEQDLCQLRVQVREAPSPAELEDAFGAGVLEVLVTQVRLPPCRATRQHDEQANADGEHVRGLSCVAVGLRSRWGVRLNARLQQNLAQIRPVDLRRRHVPGLRIRGRDDVDKVSLGHVALRSAVEVLANLAEVPQRDSAGSPGLHSHAEVHHADGTAVQQDVLQGQIAVADAVAVQKGDGLEDLPSVPHGAWLWERPFRLHLAEQLTAVGELRDEPHVGNVPVQAEHLQDVHRQVRLL
mmetsp:Transcript_44434/g.88220  ORF Transcript_44434/g.88220 Transcript_44434/m.88220 type:complete len:277 (+) Transcript_44434:58-888(+)